MSKKVRNQRTNKNPPKPRIPIVAKLAIQRYAEYPQYINPLQSVKRGEKGAGGRGRGGRKRPGREGRGEEGERLAMHVGNNHVGPDSKCQCPVKKEIISLVIHKLLRGNLFFI